MADAVDLWGINASSSANLIVSSAAETNRIAILDDTRYNFHSGMAASSGLTNGLH